MNNCFSFHSYILPFPYPLPLPVFTNSFYFASTHTIFIYETNKHKIMERDKNKIRNDRTRKQA